MSPVKEQAGGWPCVCEASLDDQKSVSVSTGKTIMEKGSNESHSES